MKRRVITLIAMFAIAYCSAVEEQGGVSASAQSGPTASSTPIMRLSEVKVGQIGKVRTVFQGAHIEEFECEVLGILRNSIGPHRDMIVVKLRGQKPEFTGVVAGMSGSPIYIDGRLVGALAYRWGIFTKEPIAGVTPIEDMLEVTSYSQPGNRQRGATESVTGSLARSGEGNDSAGTEGLGAAPASENNGAAMMGMPAMPAMVPIGTPLVFSGFDRRLFDHFAPQFQQGSFLPGFDPGFIPMLGGASWGKTSAESSFEPGAAVACILMKGDMNIAGTGTLTYRDGDRVLAFGHPMFQTGSADIPMAKADVVLTLSSSLASIKVAQPTEIIGSIKQDRLTAIMGQVGVAARMIPVSVEVNTARGEKKSYDFEMFEEPLLTPLLLNIAVSNTMLGGIYNEGVQTISLNGKVEIEGHASLNISDVMASDYVDLVFPLAVRASGQVTRVFSSLYNNPIERPLIKRISLRIDQSPERLGAVIEEVMADREEVKPGEEFSVAVVIRPHRSDRVTKVVRLKVPETAQRGQEIRVMVSDAQSFEAAEGRFARMFAQATSLDDLIEQLNRSRPSNAIYLRVSQSAPGAFINQQALPSLPLSVLSVIGSNQTAANTTAAAESALLIDVQPVNYSIAGRKIIRLMVK